MSNNPARKFPQLEQIKLVARLCFFADTRPTKIKRVRFRCFFTIFVVIIHSHLSGFHVKSQAAIFHTSLFIFDYIRKKYNPANLSAGLQLAYVKFYSSPSSASWNSLPSSSAFFFARRLLSTVYVQNTTATIRKPHEIGRVRNIIQFPCDA